MYVGLGDDIGASITNIGHRILVYSIPSTSLNGLYKDSVARSAR